MEATYGCIAPAGHLTVSTGNAGYESFPISQVQALNEIGITNCDIPKKAGLSKRLPERLKKSITILIFNK